MKPQYPFAAVQKAREWYASGRFGYDRIADLVAQEFGIFVDRGTVRQWVRRLTRICA